MNGYAIAERSARNWEKRLHITTGALDAHTPADPGAPKGGIAQDLSYHISTLVPTITWEKLMSMKPHELPDDLQVVLRDDAMAPLAPAGVKVRFTTSRSATPGDAVLVRDASGALYFREYRARLGGAWEAHASNPAYPSLQSGEHGLQIVAVFNGIDTHWAALAR
jgi:hypothetical protein